MEGRFHRSLKEEKKSLADRTGPTNVPGFVGSKVVNEMMKTPDLSDHWVKYRGVVRRQPGNKDGICDIRIFDEWDTDQSYCIAICQYLLPVFSPAK